MRQLASVRVNIRPSLLALSLALLLSTLSVAVAGAHGVEVLESDPADRAVLDRSPERVAVWFNEELQSGASSLQVFDAAGRQVDDGDGGVDLNDPDHASMIVRLPALPDGAYRVRWHAVLLDGDASDGTLSFGVGDVNLSTDPSSSQGGAGLPLTGIVAAVGVLLLIGVPVGLVLRPRLRAKGE